jgi:hypothetical protein
MDGAGSSEDDEQSIVGALKSQSQVLGGPLTLRINARGERRSTSNEKCIVNEIQNDICSGYKDWTCPVGRVVVANTSSPITHHGRMAHFIASAHRMKLLGPRHLCGA